MIETLPDDSTNIGCLENKCLFPFLENPSWNPPLNSLQKNIRMRFAWLLLLRMGRSTCERITGTLTLNDIYLHNSFHFLHPVCVCVCVIMHLHCIACTLCTIITYYMSCLLLSNHSFLMVTLFTETCLKN